MLSCFGLGEINSSSRSVYEYLLWNTPSHLTYCGRDAEEKQLLLDVRYRTLRIESLQKRGVADYHPTCLDELIHLANAHLHSGNNQVAEVLARRAVQGYDIALSFEQPRPFQALWFLAQVLTVVRDLDCAEAVFHKLFALSRKYWLLNSESRAALVEDYLCLQKVRGFSEQDSGVRVEEMLKRPS